jgi:putative membrane protein
MSYRPSTPARLLGLVSFCLAAAASAQTPAPSTSNTNRSTAATAQTAPAPSMPAQEKVARSDRKFMEKAAQGGMAEVELGKLAAQKAQSPQVKQFGQRMVDDHGKANEQLKQLASNKGVSLPTAMDRASKREMDKLSKLSGAAFDAEYMKHMVSDHKKDVSEFKSEASKAKDADVKQFASSTLPTLEEHLKLAQQAEDVAKNESRNTTRTSSQTGTSKTGG